MRYIHYLLYNEYAIYENILILKKKKRIKVSCK